MALAIIRNGAAIELARGQDVPVVLPTDPPDIGRAAYGAVESWTEEARNAGGIWTITEPDIPEGKVIASSRLQGDGPVERVATFADAPPPPVPQEVDPFPFRLALRQLGHYAAVVAWVNGEGNDIAADAWQSAVKIKRGNELITACAAALDLDDAEVDAIFVLAARIDATL